MNILYIAHESELGGASLSLLGLIDELKKRHNITVLSAASKGPLLQELDKRGIPVITRKMYFWTLPKEKTTPVRKLLQRCALFFNYLILPGIVREVKKRRIELIHSNTSILPIGGLLYRATGIPHVWHVREFVEQGLAMSYVFGKRKTRRRMEKNSTRMVVISKALEKEYENFVSPQKLLCIYNGISLKGDAVLPEPIRLLLEKDRKENGVPFLIAGRVSAYKGQIEAIEALSILVNEKNINAVLWIAGEGEIEKCRNKAKQLQIEDRVIFLGRVTYLEAFRPCMRAELVCSACEAFGRVTIEAYLAGIPVIGTDAGGTPELISDGETGFLYPRGDKRALAACMEQAAKQEEECVRMGRNGNAFARKYFTVERNALDIERLYQEILSEKQNRI